MTLLVSGNGLGCGLLPHPSFAPADPPVPNDVYVIKSKIYV